MDEQVKATFIENEEKTKEQLINELYDLRRQVDSLEGGRRQAEKTLQNTLEKYQKREAEISALFQCANLVLMKRDFADTARTIFESCKNLTGTTAGYVALLSKDNTENNVLFLDSGGLPCSADPDLSMPVRGLHAETYHTFKSVYHNDFSKSEWVEHMPDWHVSFDNVLFAPLVIEGTVVGFLGIADKPGDFTENDALLAETFGELAAIALYNSRTLESLESSEKRFRSVVETANDAIISADSAGHIISWNQGSEKMFGYSADEIVGKPLSTIIPDRFHKVHQQGMDCSVLTEKSKIIAKTVEISGLTKNRKEFPLELSLATWQSEGKGFITAIIRDITERKAFEEARIRDKEQMEMAQKELEKAYTELKATQAQILQREKMASIGQLSAGVAHEINNPMGFITSNLGTLDKYVSRFTEFIHAQSHVIAILNPQPEVEELKETRKKLKMDYIIEDVKDLIKESLEGAGRVKTIVQNLKTFSRVDEAACKPADINDCIESTLSIVWNELKYTATVKKDYGEIPLTRCYPQQLNQVFMNLLVNAAQAIEKQGDIVIKTWNSDGLICVSISDTGKGIPGDKFDKIFEPFYTTKEVGKGTGLGLSITYEIVKKHNGEITVDSKVEKGSTFTIKIPVVEGK